MAKKTRTRWIAELDYASDPETEASVVRALVQDEISRFPGAEITDTSVILTNTNQALAFKLRFNNNISSFVRG